MPLNAITTQLGRLKEAQFVEVLGGVCKGRTANYTVPDKLFRHLVHQMRQVPQPEPPAHSEMFVEVLRVWFEEEERLVHFAQAGIVPEQSGSVQVLRDANHG